MGWELVIIAPV